MPVDLGEQVEPEGDLPATVRRLRALFRQDMARYPEKYVEQEPVTDGT